MEDKKPDTTVISLLKLTGLQLPLQRLSSYTHEITLFETILREYASLWELKEVVKVFQGGLHPRIYVFRAKVGPS